MDNGNDSSSSTDLEPRVGQEAVEARHHLRDGRVGRDKDQGLPRPPLQQVGPGRHKLRNGVVVRGYIYK